MEIYIDKLISENDIKWLIYERVKLNTIISETRELLKVALSHQEKLERQIEADEALVVYINKNL